MELALIVLAVWELCPDYFLRFLCLITAAPLLAYLVVNMGGARTAFKAGRS